ncbi:hypothetical protein ACSW8L_15935 (plasmid) [Clostridium perfringens]
MNWKEELLNAKEEVVYVKYKRGEGATYTVIEKILNTDKDLCVLYLGNYYIVEDILSKLYRNKDKRIESLLCSIENREIIVNLINNKWLKIVCTRLENANESFKRGLKFHIGIADNSDFSMPKILNRCKQKIIIMSDEDTTSFRIINSDKVKEKLNKDENQELSLTQRINNYRKKLFTELENIPMNDKTTMTRERIIGMIKSLDHIGK